VSVKAVEWWRRQLAGETYWHHTQQMGKTTAPYSKGQSPVPSFFGGYVEQNVSKERVLYLIQ
jgi:hypothetical protein